MSLPSPYEVIFDLDLWQFSFNGCIFGGIDIANDPYPFVQATGLDMPTVQSSDAPMPFDQGTFVGWDLYGPRSILVQVIVRPFGGQTLRQQMNRLKAALPLGLNQETPLYLNTGDGIQCVTARVRQMPYAIDVNWLLGEGVVVEIGFQATDPRVYSTPTQQQGCSTGSPLTGFTFPFTFDVSFTPGVVTGSISIDNIGDFEIRPTLILYGPLTDPVITSAYLPGEPSLAFSIPGGGLTIAEGEQLVIQTANPKSVMLFEYGSSVGSSRRNWLVQGSTWFNIPPGENEIGLTSGDASDTGGLTIWSASAWDAA